MPTDAPIDAPAADSTSELPHALEPFVASYKVFHDGRALGDATLQVVKQMTQQDPPRWRVDLNMSGRGLFRLAGINAEQSTVFEDVTLEDGGEAYRPLSQGTLRRTLFTRKQTTGTYDWASSTARWKGDIKETRSHPIDLQPGDMSGLLINLAVIRDAEPGETLRYRYVDNGRVRQHEYRVAEELEGVSIGELSYYAMRVTRVQGGGEQNGGDQAGSANPDNEETVIWVVSGVPTPIRMLQRENGEDTYDLRLVEYTGVQ
jgi:hypothetical protein